MRIEELAEQLKEELSHFCYKIEIAGSIRRKSSNPRDIDLVCISSNPDKLMDFIENSNGVTVLRKGDKLISFEVGTTLVDVYFTDKEHYGAMLMFLTGPSGSNIGMRMKAKSKGYLLNQYGLYKDGKLIASRTEEEIAEVLNYKLKPPELRGK